MRMVLAGMAAITLCAGIAASAPAQAQSGGGGPWGIRAWCLQTGNNFPNCSYYTQRQCLETGRGAYRGYSCIPNPYLSEGRGRPRRGY